jgi:hypothetical protein
MMILIAQHLLANYIKVWYNPGKGEAVAKDKLSDLDVDAKLLIPEDDEESFEEELTLSELIGPKPQKDSLPAHIKRSHKTEEDEWNYSILTSHSDKLVLKVGTREQAQQKRNRLYNARTYLKYVEKIKHGLPVYEGPLDDWTLCLTERAGVWCIMALNLKLKEGWVEEEV